MKPEIEAVFTDIDKPALRAKLRAAGAELITPERKMVRTVFKTDDPSGPEKPHSFLRVRDEGDKVVVTYKKFVDHSVTGVRELNITVDDYAKTVKLFRELGFTAKSYEESLRESWRLDGAEIDIDTWPWLPPYVEVEGSSVENMTSVSEKLGFSMENALYGSVGAVYELYYDIREEDLNAGLGGWSRIEFIDTPAWLEVKRKK